MVEMGLDAVNSLSSAFDFSYFDFASLNHWHLDWQTFAAPQPQQFNQDVTKDLAGGWNNFIRTGQVWALLIGVVLGYLFKSITSF